MVTLYNCVILSIVLPLKELFLPKEGESSKDLQLPLETSSNSSESSSESSDCDDSDEESESQDATTPSEPKLKLPQPTKKPKIEVIESHEKHAGEKPDEESVT